MEFTQEWDLTTIPDEALRREVQRRRARKPRPTSRKPAACIWCKEMQPTATERRAHQRLCSKNPRVQRILEAQAKKTLP